MTDIVGVVVTIVATYYLIKLWMAARIPFDPEDEHVRISRFDPEDKGKHVRISRLPNTATLVSNEE